MNYLSSMQPLDKHTLFSIFEKGDEEIYKEHGMEETLKNPFVLMGMVVNGIQNFDLMDMMYARNYPEEYKEVKHTIKYKYFTKLYGYLCRINHDTFEDKHNIGESYDSADIYYGLNVLKDYFESIEQYEKCGTIKKYMELLIDKVVPLKKISYI